MLQTFLPKIVFRLFLIPTTFQSVIIVESYPSNEKYLALILKTL
jgi:hypothetical protein